jgi:hypothetical protein
VISLLKRIDELLRPKSEEAGSAPERLGLDLVITAIGLFAFGMVIPTGVDPLFRGLVGLKLAAAFLLTFVVILGPLYALQRFFEVEVPFAKIIGAFARHLALGGIFAAALAGVYGLLRRGEPQFDGVVALSCIIGLIGAVLACRRRGQVWLPKVPASLAVILFLSVLAQSAWAFRPYLDPGGPTLFASRTEWLTGQERQGLEHLIRHFKEQAKPRPGP